MRQQPHRTSTRWCDDAERTHASEEDRSDAPELSSCEREVTRHRQAHERYPRLDRFERLERQVIVKRMDMRKNSVRTRESGALSPLSFVALVGNFWDAVQKS